MQATVPVRPATILIVEDQPELRELVEIALARAGYGALVASDGVEALQLLATRSVDLVLTDISLPGKSGLALAGEVRAVRPDLKVVFTTGYNEEAERWNEAKRGKLLRKPFRIGVLLEAVRAALEE